MAARGRRPTDCSLRREGGGPGRPTPRAANHPGAINQPQLKMSSGRNADTTKLGTSTSSLIFRSTATLQIA